MTDSRIDGRRIAQLLDEVRAAAGPVAWPRVEALVTALVDLYGCGIERILEHAHEEASNEGGFVARLCRDELVSSLLTLHGIHPIPVADRIEAALAHVRAELPESAELALSSVANGTATLVLVSPNGRSSPPLAVVARAIEYAAPEIDEVRIEGLETPEKLLSADRLLRRGAA